MKSTVNQIITALMELEAKGCHSVFFEYGNGLFHVRIYNGEIRLGKTVYEKTIYHGIEQSEMVRLSNLIGTLSSHVYTTVFQCYRQEFVNGKKSGKWEKTKPSFEYGDNATQSMLIDGSGYYIDDPENGVQYFVSMKELSETGK
jgi:hypothetical protein